MTIAREVILDRLKADLIGPSYGVDEVISERPSDRYLTGILFPQKLEVPAEEDEEIDDVQSGSALDANGSNNDSVSIFRTQRPATAGISFAVNCKSGAIPKIKVDISCGKYTKIEREIIHDEDTSVNTDGPEESKQNLDGSASGEVVTHPIDAKKTPLSTTKTASMGLAVGRNWKRIEGRCIRTVSLSEPIIEIDLGESSHGEEIIRGLGLFLRVLIIDKKWTVTLQAVNKNESEPGQSRDENEEKCFFQFSMCVYPIDSTELVPRPVRGVAKDDDEKTAALIYRHAKEYATGHTVSANWVQTEQGKVKKVETTWCPQRVVRDIDPEGDPIFSKVYADRKLEIPNAKLLAEADEETLYKLLDALPDAYHMWLEGEALKVELITQASSREQASVHLKRCYEALRRMRSGISSIRADENVRRAFQAANAAMQTQAAWSRGYSDGIPGTKSGLLVWRPFQLGFTLMCIDSFRHPDSEERDIFDLIWFPTGGGKTEAYLLVAAFVMFYRRLSDLEKVSSGGTAILMRYTLRTLTVQQFERGAALICASEVLRQGSLNSDGALGKAPFSIGLWVGEPSTPNTSEKALKALGTDSESTPCQIKKCPACKEDLIWEAAPDHTRVWVRCETKGCMLEGFDELPINTVDDQLYKNPPTILIGTVDKFAQIVRRDDVKEFFGKGTGRKPPELIIQDELHLISGPLGTLTGIYESVIDALCTIDGVRPKIIGSTATIRRADAQIKALFNRKAFQFPPPVIDGENSGFAKLISGEEGDSTGRLYVGLTTAGRTDKYMLQAVCASLLQATNDPLIAKEKKDPYGTLVAYFNSLRILGGALVAMQDDVTKSIDAIAQRRGEVARQISEPEEMTSRKASREIPEVLNRLTVPLGQPGSLDVLLASNMLSVGVDIPRLGLMVVSGQPKTMSEYIQATSRVGRNKIAGLVITIYNHPKIRDRSHYETFETWHSSLYRSIEATSVTPFAPRARDKALHAALVGLARHLLPDFASDPSLNGEKREKFETEILPILLDRISEVDGRELGAAEAQIERLLDDWEDRGILKYYWNDLAFKNSLLISAEKAAARRASGLSEAAAWETPNSMRNVEPGVDFQLWESAELNRD